MTGLRRPIQPVLFRPTERRGGAIGGGIAPPGAPTIGTATAGSGQATVTFTAPGSIGGGPITGYRATSSPGGITATGASSPITVTGLTNGVAYTFTVAAQNAGGYGPESAASNSVTPSAATFALTNKTNTAGGSGGGIFLMRTGEARNIINGTAGAGNTIAGEWVATGAFSTIGDGYEAVATLVSGTPAVFSAAFGSAVRINADTSFALQTAGSFSVIIRPFGGGATVASATYTVT